MKNIKQPLRCYLAELVLGIDVTIDVAQEKGSSEWGIDMKNELPLAVTHPNIPSNYLVKGSVTIEKNGKPIAGTHSQKLPIATSKRRKPKNQHDITLTVNDGDKVVAHLKYSVGDLHFDYRRPLHYLENTERECARVLINDRQVWVPGTLIGDHFGWNLCFTLPSGQRIPAASFSLKLKVYPPKGSGEQPWFSPVFDRKTLHYFKQLKAGTSADFLYVSARKKAEARIPAVQLK